jgi:3-oxoacyl-[acyl-carrier-protein] synthase-1
MNGEPIHITALGASTPVGRDPWSSAAAVRAGISGISEHPYMVDTVGEPMRAVIAPWLEIELSGARRLEALLLPAIDQVIDPLSEARGARLRLALALALPAPRPGLPGRLESTLRKAIEEKYRDTFEAVAVFPYGHAAGLLALEAAATRLAQGIYDACIVVGVDSYIDPDTLEWLEECDQLHSAGPLSNAWGFIPGEGAGAILLVRSVILERLHLVSLGRILGPGTAFERNGIKGTTPCIGEGLTQAFRVALQELPQGGKITDIYCDMNGEPYRADEYGFACARIDETFESASDFVAPADAWGDVSAATGPLLVMLAVIAAAKSYANGQLALVWSSSEGGERAAALIATGDRSY